MTAGEGPDLPNVAAARALAEEMEGQFRKLVAEGPKMQQRARELQITEKSRDGLITVTVGARGELIRLDLDPRIYRRPDARALADEITKTVRQAGTKAREEVVELFTSLVPREQAEAHLSGDIDAVTENMKKMMRGDR